MSDFISLYQLITGYRPSKAVYDSDGNFVKDRASEEINAVSLKMVATSIADEHYSKNLHYFDKYGRYCKSDKAQKDEVLVELSQYGRLFLNACPDEIDDCVPYDPAEAPEIHHSGWIVQELPDFGACYEQWKAANGMDGIHAPPILLGRQAPSSQSHLWKLMNQLLKLVVGDEAHQLIKKDDYKTAISTLESKGLRWAENEKKALRRNLKTIVTNVQQ